eukprot:CAMPEP_0174343064 /NCGR_PEP_ID=MMETSP0810-20121108/26657_1 /TAXON_ID=73025 ORGANISM="Eutreptiella gymnastica-like, Strain CCMP1594" /NCGR_SAMPLE_ID=MMETSP0810 /ASSEMBLY_ACC=CAM_ASM_000659 /LENGTH=81 /DNA_ID=CAMNT_0015465565 /DNA_START=594 /DNA_END=840 /DNA_ORIENTATION=+
MTRDWLLMLALEMPSSGAEMRDLGTWVKGTGLSGVHKKNPKHMTCSNAWAVEIVLQQQSRRKGAKVSLAGVHAHSHRGEGN